MTPKEALQEIINTPKNDGIWYKCTEDETLRTYLRITALRILNGTAKTETMKKFFEKFGYEFETVVTKK